MCRSWRWPVRPVRTRHFYFKYQVSPSLLYMSFSSKKLIPACTCDFFPSVSQMIHRPHPSHLSLPAFTPLYRFFSASSTWIKNISKLFEYLFMLRYRLIEIMLSISFLLSTTAWIFFFSKIVISNHFCPWYRLACLLLVECGPWS